MIPRQFDLRNSGTHLVDPHIPGQHDKPGNKTQLISTLECLGSNPDTGGSLLTVQSLTACVRQKYLISTTESLL